MSGDRYWLIVSLVAAILAQLNLTDARQRAEGSESWTALAGWVCALAVDLMFSLTAMVFFLRVVVFS